jgi:hypothetical protein
MVNLLRLRPEQSLTYIFTLGISDVKEDTIIVKNSLGFSILYCTIFNVIDKSYRQVLTLINNFQLLLKLEILDKFRLLVLLQTNSSKTKETVATFSSLLWYRRNRSFHDLEPLSVDAMVLAASARANIFTFGDA